MNEYANKIKVVVDTLGKIKIVPVLVLNNLDEGLKMCELLVKCNLKAAEITFRTQAAEAVKNSYAFAPGICTPSEVEQAYELGCSFLKFFPAEASGGVNMLKSLIAPYKHLGVRFMPTGGVSTANVESYLSLPEVVAVGGTWLGKSSDLAAGNFDAIEKAVTDAVALASKF